MGESARLKMQCEKKKKTEGRRSVTRAPDTRGERCAAAGGGVGGEGGRRGDTVSAGEDVALPLVLK